nr:hypothetical protein [uncultured Streptococcus sp.]
MFSQLRMREEQALLAHDYALERAEEKGLERGRAEGIEQGLERGKVEGSLSMLLNLVRQHLLSAEVESEQLGMSVAEFESLLQGHILNSRKLMEWRVISKMLLNSQTKFHR